MTVFADAFAPIVSLNQYSTRLLYRRARAMRQSDGGQVLNKIPVTAWVLGTAAKMSEAKVEAISAWNRLWLDTYRELGGQSEDSGSKGCPKAAAYGLWFLGLLRNGRRPQLMWSVAQINRELGKNAAYVAIATQLLQQGAAPEVDRLWPVIQTRYRELIGEVTADSEQGEIRLVAALFRENQLVSALPTEG